MSSKRSLKTSRPSLPSKKVWLRMGKLGVRGAVVVLKYTTPYGVIAEFMGMPVEYVLDRLGDCDDTKERVDDFLKTLKPKHTLIAAQGEHDEPFAKVFEVSLKKTLEDVEKGKAPYYAAFVVGCAQGSSDKPPSERLRITLLQAISRLGVHDLDVLMLVGYTNYKCEGKRFTKQDLERHSQFIPSSRLDFALIPASLNALARESLIDDQLPLPQQFQVHERSYALEMPGTMLWRILYNNLPWFRDRSQRLNLSAEPTQKP